MINYIIQVVLFQAIFLAVYDLILRKETFFQWNRAYLIFTSILAFILPLLKFNTVQQNIPDEYIVMLPEVILSPETIIEKHIDWSGLLFIGLRWIFFIGMILATSLFIYKMFQLIKIIYQNKKEKNEGYNLILLGDSNTAYSFFKYVFIGKDVMKKEQIIAHELVHVKQKHSIDLMVFEIQKILFWFNPFSYLFQSRISEVHEFIADSKSINKDDKSIYFQGLLAQVFQVEKFAFINSFYKKSIIKKRIIMLGKNKSKEILKLKYLLLIPMFMGMLIYTSCETAEPDLNKESSIKEALIELMQDKMDKGQGSKEELEFVKNFDLPKSLNNKNNENFETEKIERLLKMVLNMHKNGKNKKNTEKVDYSNASEVPFAIIDQAPIFPGCEDAEDQKKCFMENIQKHVGKNFDTSFKDVLGLESGKTRVYVQFEIDNTGSIESIRARAPHKDLEKEAIRVISELPKMQPGKYKGKTVGTKYTLPITLIID